MTEPFKTKRKDHKSEQFDISLLSSFKGAKRNYQKLSLISQTLFHALFLDSIFIEAWQGITTNEIFFRDKLFSFKRH